MLVNKNQVVAVLEEIKQSVIGDVEPVLKAYGDLVKIKNDARRVGFWTIPRIIFPEIDGIARLRYGRLSDFGSSKDSICFIREYFPGNVYKQIAGFLYAVFRHGLLHSHYPKSVIIRGKDRGWAVVLSSPGVIPMHLEFMVKTKKTHLTLDAREFYSDFIAAIDKYIKEFDDGQRQAMLTTLFNRAYHQMISPQLEQDFCKNKYINTSDIDYFK